MSPGKKMEWFAAHGLVFIAEMVLVLLVVTVLFTEFQWETDFDEFLASPRERTFSGFWRFYRGDASTRDVVVAMLKEAAFPLLLMIVYAIGILKPVLEKRKTENRRLDKTYVWLIWVVLAIGLVIVVLRIWHYHCVDMEARRLMADEGLRWVRFRALKTELRTELGEEIVLHNWGGIAGTAVFVLCCVLGMAAVWCGQNADKFDKTPSQEI